MPQVYLPAEDTIAAIATPPGEGGIAVIRISGKGAMQILERVFKREGKGRVFDMESHRLYLGHIFDPESEKTLDRVLCVFMKSPHSYTGEDVTEIHSPGGYLVPKRILNLIFKHGARPARPGEFTLRAFLNGKMDLAQAEAVADVVNAQTEEGLKQAELQLEGVLSRRIGEFKETLLDTLAEIEAHVDFPEEDIDPFVREGIAQHLTRLVEEMDKLLATYEKGRIIKHGVYTAILGKPNVGKSSLLNQLIMKERAIVSPYPGTTRDFIEETIDINGIPLRLVDTAGLRATADEVERLGVEFAKKKAEEAELIIAVVDGSTELDRDDFEVLNRVRESIAPQDDSKHVGAGFKPAPTLNQNTKKGILVINKSDLPQKLSEEYLAGTVPEERIVRTSAKLGSGMEELKNKIYEALMGRRDRVEGNEIIITEHRHKVAIERAKESLAAFLKAIERGESPEFLAIDLRSALDFLGEITGEITTEDVLGHIFSKFCIGK
ncbi:MAG: tRNA uridine-5-carboxymethylaminomethyl(34) synthesis GTPase MnmE [Ignavibacteriales bacterium]